MVLYLSTFTEAHVVIGGNIHMKINLGRQARVTRDHGKQIFDHGMQKKSPILYLVLTIRERPFL